jgi:small subunit ribosomal protein S9
MAATQTATKGSTKPTQTVGRRKCSVASVFMRPGTGNIMVNGKPFQQYFERETLKMVIMQPLVLIGETATYDFHVNVRGGGKTGQAGAVRLGIARALVNLKAESRGEIKKAGYLTRDDRSVERKKYGHHKARRRPQYSKR